MAEAKETTGAAPTKAAPAGSETGSASPATEVAPKVSAPAKGSEPKETGETRDYAGVDSRGGGSSTAPTSTGSGRFTPFFLMGGVVLLFYFMIMRPQKKRERERKDMLGQIKVGDKVVTASGIVGEIMELTETDAILKIDPRKDVRMRVRRAAVAGPAGDAGSEEAVSSGGS
jgi:preprotein translocase YajC subunit